MSDPHPQSTPEVPGQTRRTVAKSRCPRCNSPDPHLHPSVQHEGDVQPCGDPFHEIVTAQNTVERIAAHRILLARLTTTTATTREET